MPKLEGRWKSIERGLEDEEHEVAGDRSVHVKFEVHEDINRRSKALLERTLEEDILTNPQFVGCCMMFLKWFNQAEGQVLRPAVDAVSSDKSVRIFAPGEQAGMTAASLLKQFFAKRNVEYEAVTKQNKIEVNKRVARWMRDRFTGEMKDENGTFSLNLSEDQAKLLWECLLTYMSFTRETPETFSRINPVTSLDNMLPGALKS